MTEESVLIAVEIIRWSHAKQKSSFLLRVDNFLEIFVRFPASVAAAKTNLFGEILQETETLPRRQFRSGQGSVFVNNPTNYCCASAS